MNKILDALHQWAFCPSIENDIQIDLVTIEEPYRTFIHDTITEANKLGVAVFLSSERQVDLEAETGTKCNGYFCDDIMTLAVACGQDFMSWFSVFIHESSHMDQWHENDPTWIESAKEVGGVEVGVALDLWLYGHMEANEDQLRRMIAPTRDVELNCERRTIQKIKDHNLPMDVTHYARRANAYIYFYNVMGIVRKWYTIGKEPYNIPEIINAMPTNLDGDYTCTPPAYEKLLLTHMFPEFKR